jgi:hypothetical protein
VKANELFPSNYISAADLQPQKNYIVTIASVEMREMNDEQSGGKKQKPVICFMESKDNRGLVLNRINMEAIFAATGTDDTDQWHGKKVAMYRTKVPFGAKLVDAIRIHPEPASQFVRAADGAGATRQPAPAPEPPPIEFGGHVDDDSIPF